MESHPERYLGDVRYGVEAHLGDVEAHAGTKGVKNINILSW
jgi:hypothetical protein